MTTKRKQEKNAGATRRRDVPERGVRQKIAEPAEPVDPDCVMDPKHGVGLEWQHRDDTLYTTLRKADTFDGRRVCRVKVTSYVGTDIDAMHWYARLRPSEPDIRSHKHPTYSIVGACGCPINLRLSTLDAERVLTTVEHDARGRVLGKVGETSTRFNSEQSARDAAIALFRKRFPAGWVLIEGDECEYVETPVVLASS